MKNYVIILFGFERGPEAPEKHEKPCPVCGGTGEKDGETCPSCQGSGLDN